MNSIEGIYENGHVASTNGVTVPIDEPLRASPVASSPLAFARSISRFQRRAIWRASVDLIEPTGFGIIVHAMVANGLPVKIFTQDRAVMGAGRDIRMAFPVERLHLFGADGQRVV